MEVATMRTRVLSVACLFWILVQPAAAEVPGSHEVIVRRLHPKAIVVGSGGTYGDTMLALASERGLVVVDTGTTTTLTRSYRKKIEEVFGRTDFAFVVNTHYHYDHTVGNPVFPEATVVGHELTRSRLYDWYNDLDTFVARQRGRVVGWRSAAENLDPGDDRLQRLRDIEYSYGQMCEDLENEYELHPPTITFADRMNLELGDLTLRLYAYGPGTHTGDDILVHIPEIGVVATGDLFHHEYVRFVYRLEPGIDIGHKVAVLDAILADKGMQHVVPVHSRVMSRDELVARRNYMAEMWEVATGLAEKGGTLAEARKSLDLESRFGYLTELGIDPGELTTQHEAGVETVWMVAKGGSDATVAINEAFDEGGTAAAREAFARILPLMGEEYYIDEGAFNNLGYRLLAEDRLDEAVAVFEMNTEAFPDSSNTYDSLGEALAARGDIDRAITAYRRSLELDPENSNGAAQLKRLEAIKTGG
jgi:glyoxylase-like metal-dependent hydrolase (beta-lactamase superfamily II)